MTRTPEQPQPPPALEITVNVTGLDEFKDLMQLVIDVYAMSDEPTKEYIEAETRRIVGRTHDMTWIRR